MQNTGKLKRSLQLAFGVLLFGGLVILLGAQNGWGSLQALGKLRPGAMGTAGLCTIVIAGCIGARWRSLVLALTAEQGRTGDPRSENTDGTRASRPLSWLQACRYFVWNRMIGFLIPKDISDIGGRVLLLKTRHGLSVAQASTSVLLDRGFDLLALLLFLGPAVLYQTGTLTMEATLAAMGMLALGGYGLLWWVGDRFMALGMNVYQSVMARHSGKRNPEQRAAKGDTRETTATQSALWKVRLQETTLRRATLANAFGLSALKIATTGARFACYALALDMDASPLLFLVGTPITQLSFLIALTPGGLGLLEATWYGILHHYGLPPEAIATFLLTQRLGTMLWVAILTAMGEGLAWLHGQITNLESCHEGRKTYDE